jgi:hypothetical protein
MPVAIVPIASTIGNIIDAIPANTADILSAIAAIFS